MVGMYIIIPIVTFIIGGLLAWLGMRFLLKSKYDSVLQEAEKEAEVIKKNKMLEVKEKFLHLKADLEKQVSQRNAKIQSVETKLKQRELTMNQRQEELQRRNNEVEAVKENLSSQLELVEKKKQDLDKLHQKEVEHLEAISGLSAEEAKERLIESLKDEAKTQAASYINEIVEEAKMTANKEAKKIVIQSIQRVATETAIENSITVFHIESDEIKGRIIGREDVISVLWKPLPVLRSWWMIRLRLSFFPDSIRFAVRSLVWPCINWYRTDVSIRLVSRRW